jgi:hypothetical protein
MITDTDHDRSRVRGNLAGNHFLYQLVFMNYNAKNNFFISKFFLFNKGNINKKGGVLHPPFMTALQSFDRKA